MTKKERKRKKKLQSRNRHLVKKYYWLEPRRWDGKRDKDYDYTYINWGWSDGWNKAFGNMYMKELGDAINEAGQKDFQILQVKEKFAQARLYCGGTTRKVLDIIDKYERISEHICERCGCEAPMIEEGSWFSVYCPRCYRLLYRRREQWFNTKEGYIPKTDEEINEIYKGYIIDEPDENGEYHMQNTYTVKHYRSSDTVDEVYDISDTVEKIQKRISKFKREE